MTKLADTTVYNTLEDEVKDIERMLGRLEVLLERRKGELKYAEHLQTQRVLRDEITYLNAQSCKKNVQYMYLMHASLELNCKMLRRNIFFLLRRKEKALERRRLIAREAQDKAA